MLHTIAIAARIPKTLKTLIWRRAAEMNMVPSHYIRCLLDIMTDSDDPERGGYQAKLEEAMLLVREEQKTFDSLREQYIDLKGNNETLRLFINRENAKFQNDDRSVPIMHGAQA